MRKVFLLVAIALVFGLSVGCTKPDKATQVLISAGYSDILLTGYKFFGCSEDDAFHTGFIAKSPGGQEVEGVVCSGIFKGNTIRLD